MAFAHHRCDSKLEKMTRMTVCNSWLDPPGRDGPISTDCQLYWRQLSGTGAILQGNI